MKGISIKNSENWVAKSIKETIHQDVVQNNYLNNTKYTTVSLYDTVNFHLDFNKDLLLDDVNYKINKIKEFFRFNFRYTKACLVFVLLTNTLNGITTAF